MIEMDIGQVLEYLPHRYPFLLIDAVRELEHGKRIVAVKNVTINEPCFQGHFPGRPIFPGVLILEAMAQAAGILIFKTAGQKPDEKSVYYYAGIDKARFKKPVLPGDSMAIEVIIERSVRNVWKLQCAARVEGAVVCEASIMCTVRTSAEA